MATAIKDRAEFDECRQCLADQLGLHVPDDVQTVEELQRHMLTGLKTRAALLAQQEAKRSKKNRGRNPDSPTDDEEGMRDSIRAAQFSTGNDETDARLAKELVDQQERYMASPHGTTPRAY